MGGNVSIEDKVESTVIPGASGYNGPDKQVLKTKKVRWLDGENGDNDPEPKKLTRSVRPNTLFGIIDTVLGKDPPSRVYDFRTPELEDEEDTRRPDEELPYLPRLSSRPILPIGSLVNTTQDSSTASFATSLSRVDTTPFIYPTPREPKDESVASPSASSEISKVADVKSGNMLAADGALIGAGVFMIVVVSYVGAIF